MVLQMGGGTYFATAGSELHHLLVRRGFRVIRDALLLPLCQESGTTHVEQLAGLVLAEDEDGGVLI